MAEQYVTPRLYALADTHVYLGENANRHNGEYVNMGRYGGTTQCGFFRFAEAALPQGSRVVSARLHFRIRYKSGGGAYTFTVRPAGGLWTETGLRGSAMPVSAGISDTVSIGWGTSSVDVTASVRALLDGTHPWANGLYIACSAADSNTSVHSRACASADGRPYLLIAYELPVSKPVPETDACALGDTLRVNIQRAEEGDAHVLRYVLGENVLASRTAQGGADAFLLPETWARSIPCAESALLRIECDTYLDGERMGTDSACVTVLVPAGMVPQVSAVEVREGCEHWPAALAGRFVQGRSRLAVAVTAAGAGGSTVESVCVTVCDKSYAGPEVVTDAIGASGTVNVAVTVTDSRGRTASGSAMVAVAAYAEPTISRFSVWRSDAAGAYGLSGEHAAVSAAAAGSDLGGLNALSCHVDCREAGTESWTEAGALTAANCAVNALGAVLPLGAAFDDLTGYEFRLRVSDLFAARCAYAAIPTKLVVLDVSATGRGVGVGCEAAEERTLTVSLNTRLDGPLHILNPKHLAAAQGRWTRLAPTAGAENYPEERLMWRRVGDLLHVNGVINLAAASGGTAFAVLPEGIRPPKYSWWWGVSGGARMCVVTAAADGALSVACYDRGGGAYTASTWHQINGCFWLDNLSSEAEAGYAPVDTATAT